MWGVHERSTLEGHPRLGASWEGFAIEQILAHTDDRYAYHWATHGGAELDLLVASADRRIGFEFKYTSAPHTSRSMHVALADLRLDHLFVVAPVAQAFPLAERITAVPPSAVLRDWTTADVKIE
jgi:predicted AAA+ superfamily ATPase